MNALPVIRIARSSTLQSVRPEAGGRRDRASVLRGVCDRCDPGDLAFRAQTALNNLDRSLHVQCWFLDQDPGDHALSFNHGAMIRRAMRTSLRARFVSSAAVGGFF